MNWSVQVMWTIEVKLTFIEEFFMISQKRHMDHARRMNAMHIQIISISILVILNIELFIYEK